jgi:glycosyltransferase domain-containing protein
VNNFSLLIPTMNRSRFIRRALCFYRDLGFSGEILIGDSSNKDEYLASQAAVKEVGEDLTVKHIFLPANEFPTCAAVVKHLISLAETEYLAQFGDDDILLPKGVKACIDFLDEHQDYVAACGAKRLEFSLSGKAEAYGEVDNLRLVQEPQLDSCEFQQRYVSYMRNAIAPSYSVFRKEVLEYAYKDLDKATTRYIGPELLAGSLAVVQGRIKQLNLFTLMFQIHDDHHFSWHKSSLFDLFFDEGFGRTITIFRDSVVKAMSLQIGYTSRQAESIVEGELFRHFSKMLAWQYKSRFAGKVDDPVGNPTVGQVERPYWLTCRRAVLNTTIHQLYWFIRKKISRKRVLRAVKGVDLAGSKYEECGRVVELLQGGA